VIIGNIIATSRSRMSSCISAVDGFYIENVTLHDIILRSPGGGSEEDAQSPVPERPAVYPENRMFGWTLPAYGIYIRHARNITLTNIQLYLDKPDLRPALWLEDAHQVRLTSLRADNSPNPDKLIKKVNVTDFESK